jgi:streptogramin lyase
MSELLGNRILRLDPNTKEVRAYELPLSWSGPRRFDVDRHGDLWIPGYATGSLWKLEPQPGTFKEFLLR